MRTPRGLALLLVVGVLSVLAVLAITFVSLTRLERRAARQRLQQTQARLLSRSGLEDALARLSGGQVPSYGGEDWDNDGALSVIESSQEVFQAGTLNALDCPVRHAMRPSFFRKDASGKPKLQGVDGRERGLSGPGYALKVEDESGKINLNGGILDDRDRDLDGIPDHRDPDPGVGWNAQLVRILDVLGAQPEVGIPTLGQMAVSTRPKGGWPSIPTPEEMAAMGFPKVDLSPYLATRSWADTNVIRPHDQTTAMGASNCPTEIKRMRANLALEEGGRPPVNLNAASLPVLVALLSGLQGREWAFYTTPTSHAIPAPMDRDIAQGLRGRVASQPFTRWEDFYAFCDTLVPTLISGQTATAYGWGYCGGNLAVADLLKANFDPNTASTKELPDQIRWRWLDKTDLSAWSTEGALEPTGIFRVSSVGRVLDPGGRLLAEATSKTLVEAFRPLRQSSQADFVGGRPSVAEYLSLASPPHRTTGASAAWASQGLAAITYPCPPPALPGQACLFDGAIGLASTELAPSNPSGGSLLFVHHFDDSWGADLGNPTTLTADPGGGSDQLQTNLATNVWTSLPLEPNTVYPDGAHLQAYRCPAFAADLNLPPSWTTGDLAASDHGSFSYWVKGMATGSGGGRIDFRCSRSAGGGTQVLQIGFDAAHWGILAENRAVAGDAEHERCYVVYFDNNDMRMPDQRWHLITAHLDTDDLDQGDDVFLSAKGALIPQDDPIWQYSLPLKTSLGESLFVPGTHFSIGFGLPNQLIDEFAIYDFTDDGDDAVLNASDWASERFMDGRYYKGGDARFLSTALQPAGGTGARLLWARWTEWLPNAPRQELLWPQVDVFSGEAPESGVPRKIDPTLIYPDGRSRLWIELDLMDQAAGLASPPLKPLAQGGRVEMTLPSFRYRVRFKTDLVNADNDPVLETPFLDDVTFTWQPTTGPRILSWERP